MAKRQRPKPIQSNNTTNPILSNNLSLKVIRPLTLNQEIAFDNFEKGQCMLLLGSAGTGKSYQAIYHVLKDIQEGRLKKLVIIRSPVQTKEIGHMPGNLEEKANFYTEPYIHIVNDLFGRDDAWTILTKHKVIEFRLTSFIRGLTIDNAGVVFDECQSSSLNELITIITRSGKNTKVHYLGDYAQSDIKTKDRVLNQFIAILDRMEEFTHVNFTILDCVRSGLVKSFLVAQDSVYGDKIIV